MQEHDFQQVVVRSRIATQWSSGYSKGFVADPCPETVGPNVTEEYSIGETDFECLGQIVEGSCQRSRG
jgi:hypothetical protein